MVEKTSEVKRVNLALQGGGSHGAYTWGVLDSLLADSRLSIEGIVGTSAGGLNGAATIMGLLEGGPQGARDKLRKLWEGIAKLSYQNPFKLDPVKKMSNDFRLPETLAYYAGQLKAGAYSPHIINPEGLGVFSPLLKELLDYKKLQEAKDHKLFLCATHITSGRLKIFRGSELSEKAILASSTLATLFQATEVDGEYYWDGGYTGNPVIYPLIYHCESPDIILVQLRPVYSPKVPVLGHEIIHRLGDITQNSCLYREMRTIHFISRLMDEGVIAEGAIKRLHVHSISDDLFFSTLSWETCLSTDEQFIQYLFKAGQSMGRKWLKENFDSIGKRTTAEMGKDFLEDITP